MTVRDILAGMTSEQIKNLSPERRGELQAQLDLEGAELRKKLIASEMALELQRCQELAMVDRAKLEGRFPTGPYLGRFYYYDGVTPELRTNVVAVETKEDSPKFFEFSTPNFERLPALPLKETGLHWSEGWDIPTLWAVDALGVVWVNDAHGSPLGISSPRDLFSLVGENHHTLTRVYALFGRKEPMPLWMRAALNAGWTPPSDFDPNSYDKG